MEDRLTEDQLPRLPAWSRSVDSSLQVNYQPALDVARMFVSRSAAVRRLFVEEYALRYCSQELDLERASGLYLLFRIVFRLPKSLNRDDARVFGGWLHPSIGSGSPTFDIAWPVRIDARTDALSVETFRGYFGKGYDALGEYDYLASRFSLRDLHDLSVLKLAS